MSDEKINLAALRHVPPMPIQHETQPVRVAIRQTTLLGLIDAVEAAHALMPLRHIDPYQPELDDSIGNLEALDEALARFTFQDDA